MKRRALAALLAALLLAASSGAAAAQGGTRQGQQAGAPEAAPEAPSPAPLQEEGQPAQAPVPSDGSEPASSPMPGGNPPGDAPLPSLAPSQLASVPGGSPADAGGAGIAAAVLGTPGAVQAPAPWAGAPMPQPAAAPPYAPGAGGNAAPEGQSPAPLTPSPTPSGGGNAGPAASAPPPGTVQAASMSPPLESPSPALSPDLPAPPPDFSTTDDPGRAPATSIGMPPPPPGESPALSPSPGLSPLPAPESPPPASPSPEAPSPSPVPAPSPPPAANAQAQALMDFKAGVSNGGDVLASWTGATDNPCSGSWLGVGCDGNQNVVSLNMTGQGLVGTISPSLAQLPSLAVVDLSSNQFTGSLPNPWQQGSGNAAQLSTLLLHSNFLGGALPALALANLANASLHDNWLTGSVPASWSSQLPGSAGVSILPQGTKGGLCGAVPDAPVLLVVPQAGSAFRVANSLGSCLQSQCPNGQNIVSLAGTNIYSVSVAGGATVWDTAALNGWTGINQAATNVQLPCYQPGSPVDGYLGGDMAYMMVAWGNGGAASSLVSTEPGKAATCGQQGTFWTVDLRWNLTLSQVVIKAGARPGINVNIAVSNSPALGSGADCATGVSTAAADVAVACGATGRYLTVYSPDNVTPMAMCSVAVYPEVANVAANKLVYYTDSSGSNQQTTYVPSQGPIQVSAPSGQAPTFVLDLGSSSAVTAVVLASAQNVASVSISATNPLLSASRRRSLQQSPAPAPLSAGLGAECAASSVSSGSYQCSGSAGDFVVVQGMPGTQLGFDSIAVFLGQAPAAAAPPPPLSPPAPPPPANPYQTMWVGNLLVGGNIGSFVASVPYTGEVLDAYNQAWNASLAAAGYSINTSATAYNDLRQNVSNPAGSPYYYGGTASGANLYTNASVSVDYRLSYDKLYSLLSTESVAQSIEASLSGSYGNFNVWMLPYSSPAPPPSGGGGLSTGAIVGIAAGGAVAVLAIALLVFCCLCRRKPRRQDSGASKASSVADLHDEHHGQMEMGALRNQYPGGTAVGPLKGQPSQQLSDARKLYAQQQEGDAHLPYGSAFSNGAPAAAAAAAAGAAGAAALASGPSHSRTASGDSSSGARTASGGVAASNSRELSTPRSASQDPVLALILRSQAEKRASASQSASPSAASAAATGGSARSTPKHRPSGSKAGLDVRVWQFSFSDLEIQKQIGEGSFGRVFLALWRETQVAVKILMNTGMEIEDVDDAERALTLSNPVLESLEKEASMMAALRHPNVVAFLGVCADPPSVVTEYCRRGSLTDVLRGGKLSAKQSKQLDWTKRLNMALDAAKGMLYLHQHSPPIIHRDLKSPNLLVDTHWRVKVSDFNLSKLMEDNAVMSSMAATNPRWLAPEILAGGKTSRESDVYAFGVVLWELLTWDIPWGVTNPWQVVTIVSDGGRLDIPSRDQLPGPDSQEWVALDAYVALLQRCWAQEPRDRPLFKEVISELRDMLERTLAARGVLGAAGGATAASTPQADGMLSGGGASASAGTASGGGAGAGTAAGRSDSGASDAVVRVSGATVAAAATVPAAAGQLHKQRSGSDGPPVALSGGGYSSMAAEVGSMADGTPRAALDSQLGGPSGSRR
ncbi:hypothetical protein ABPG75_004071 [Micractinium tetrahymenae]